MSPQFSDYALLVAAVLFALGLFGVLARRNVVYVLISVEVMLNSAGLAFISAGSKLGQPDGQVMFIFILTLAAAEASVGLALVIQFYRAYKTLDTDSARELKD